MKKTYINPEMEIVKIQSKLQLMAGSEVGAHEEEPDEYGSHFADGDFKTNDHDSWGLTP